MKSSMMIQRTNNKAIRLLQGGEFKACISTWKQALAASLLHEADDDCSSSPENNYQDMQAQGPSAVLLEGPLFSSDPLSSPGNLFSVYNVAFSLASDEFQDQERLSIVLFYNMALANHCQALTCSIGNNSTESLKRALRLYQMAFATIQANPELVEEQGFYLLLLGLVNNLGHVYSHCCMPQNAAECAQYLEMLISLPVAEDLYEDEINFFLSQVSYCSFHHCVVAAAA
jgi:hypothetical protein